MLGLAWIGVAQAGVWVHDGGTSWVQFGATTTFASTVFLPDGRRVPFVSPELGGPTAAVFSEGRGSQTELAAYAELGITKGLEVFGTFPWREVTNRWTFAVGDEPDVVLQNRGVGDPSLGLRAGGTLTGPLVGSLGAAVRGPLYNNQPEALNREAGNADLYDDLPPLGPGTVELDTLGGLGVGFGPGWAQVETGVRWRDRGFALAVPGRLQVGLRVAPPAALFLEGDWLATLPGGSQPRFYRDAYDKAPLVHDGAQRLGLGGGVLLEPLRGVVPETSATASLGLLLRASWTAVGRLTEASASLGGALTWQPEINRP